MGSGAPILASGVLAANLGMFERRQWSLILTSFESVVGRRLSPTPARLSGAHLSCGLGLFMVTGSFLWNLSWQGCLLEEVTASELDEQ